MPKHWTGAGMGFLIAAIFGIIGGLLIIAAVPAGWMYGLLVLIVSLVFVAIALLSREKSLEEDEKPLMSVMPESDGDSN